MLRMNMALAAFGMQATHVTGMSLAALVLG